MRACFKITMNWFMQSGQADIKSARVALPILHKVEHQLVAAVVEDRITIVARVAHAVRRIRSLPMHLVGDGIIKIELRCEIVGSARMREETNLEVDVHGSAAI